MAHDHAGILRHRQVAYNYDRGVLCFRNGCQQRESGESNEAAHGV
jgi:hypothetical protein